MPLRKLKPSTSRIDGNESRRGEWIAFYQPPCAGRHPNWRCADLDRTRLRRNPSILSETAMKRLHVPIALAFILATSAPYAQTPTAAPAASAAAARDCEKARHDHGAERGTPTPKSVRCAAEDSKGKKVSKAHDHNKVHK
jgi:hypothetical protein